MPGSTLMNTFKLQFVLKAVPRRDSMTKVYNAKYYSIAIR
jgi:hypothetical protein